MDWETGKGDETRSTWAPVGLVKDLDFILSVMGKPLECFSFVWLLLLFNQRNDII